MRAFRRQAARSGFVFRARACGSACERSTAPVGGPAPATTGSPSASGHSPTSAQRSAGVCAAHGRGGGKAPVQMGAVRQPRGRVHAAAGRAVPVQCPHPRPARGTGDAAPGPGRGRRGPVRPAHSCRHGAPGRCEHPPHDTPVPQRDAHDPGPLRRAGPYGGREGDAGRQRRPHGHGGPAHRLRVTGVPASGLHAQPRHHAGSLPGTLPYHAHRSRRHERPTPGGVRRARR